MVTSIARKAARGGGALLASLALVAALLPASALAQPPATQDGPLEAQAGLLASGTSGTCTWEIDAAGNLVVQPTSGSSGTLGDVVYQPWNQYVEDIRTVRIEQGVVAPESTFEMFAGCLQLVSADLSGLNTSNVTHMVSMFSGCSSLTSLDLSGFDTSNVGLMSAMFYGCTSLESINLSSFDTANVRIMTGMFNGCSSLESLDLSGFDTSGVFDADDALAGCVSLTSVKVGPKTLANLSLPSEDVDGHTDWYSEEAGRWFTSEQIDAGRKTISDVYMKSAPKPDNPGTTDPTPDDPGTTDPGTTDPTPDDPGNDPKPDDGDEPGTAEPVGTQAMYRLYNPNSGEHFYTSSEFERDSVIAAGWNDEGIGWTAPTQGIQVYRLYNSFAGEHHYTTSAEERDMLVSVGWTWEDGGWFSDVNESVPLYRAYNPNAFANNHHYTTDRGEFETLLSLGWQDEGVGWHGVN